MIRLNKILSMMPNGAAAHAIRSFNLVPNGNRRAKSVKDLAEDLGFSVALKELKRGVAGRLVSDPFSQNGYCIEVNKDDNRRRQRWTVLHEMGHYFLHSVHDDPFAAIKLRDRQDHFYLADEIIEEREADEFAAALLFDHGGLEASYSIFNGDIKKISDQFGVSEEVIRIGVKQFVKSNKKRMRP